MAFRILLLHAVTFLEVLLSTIVHLGYGLIVFGSAVWVDLMNHLLGKRSSLNNKVMPLVISAVEALQENAPGVVPTLVEHEDSSIGAFSDVHSKAPIVLVHGIFGFGKGKLGTVSYWGGAELKDDRVLVPDLGSLTSMHDRACELFYYLKGGTVDYGEEHSEQCGHSRFGRSYPHGHYPEWDENHPIHLVGHSTGVQVSRCLHQMLADKQFVGHSITNADWVLSVTSLSGAINGTTRVHLDGISVEDGRSLQAVSLLQLLRIGVLLYEWIDVPILKRYYSFGFEHYNLQWHKVGFQGLVNSFLGYSGPFATADWILPDLSIQAASRCNAKLKTHPNTYYFSYATQTTRKLIGKTVPASLRTVHPLLLLRTFQMCLWRHPTHAPLPYEGYRDEDWHDNDGALNTYSMLYPRCPTPHPHCRLEGEGATLQPGIWYYTLVHADHIQFILDRERAGVHFDIMYDSIFQRCRNHMKRKSRTFIKSICFCGGECTCQAFVPDKIM